MEFYSQFYYFHDFNMKGIVELLLMPLFYSGEFITNKMEKVYISQIILLEVKFSNTPEDIKLVYNFEKYKQLGKIY